MLNKPSVNYTEVFESFCQTYSVFHKDLLPHDIFDGMWIAPLLEHLAVLLSRLAVIADSEFEKKKNYEEEKKEFEKDVAGDPNEDEDSKHIMMA